VQMEISFPGGARVDATFEGMVVATDQPPSGGGQGSAPTPFNLFLASIGTCAGIYVLGFCRKRGIPTDGIRLTQSHQADRSSGMISRIEVDVHLPPDFPEAYIEAVVRAADLCAVKKHLADPPHIEVQARIGDEEKGDGDKG